MLAVLLCYQAQISALTAQPIEMDVVAYHSVAKALPSGAPDLTAPDNSFVRVTQHYILVADSDRFQPDSNGNRVVHIPEVKYEGQEGYSETGPATGAFDKLFIQVKRPSSKADFKPRKTSLGQQSSLDPVIYKGNKYTNFEIKSVTETVETHTLGKRRVTRISWRDDYSFDSEITSEGKVIDPSTKPLFWGGLKPMVKVDPTVYRYNSR